ncbi:MAG: phosphatidylserine decarboxylase [Acidobacteriota bacterium]
MKIAKEAWPFVLPTLVLAAVAAFLESWLVSALLLALAVAFLFFFRDPARSWDGPEEIVLAAADGVITAIEPFEDENVGGEILRIVTFLSVFNVHVQRCPVEGEVVHSSHRSGRKVAAFDREAGEINESHLTVIRRAEGDLIGTRQIVGLIARRIVPYLKPGDRVSRGQHFGVIKFGSRVDLLLPASYEPLVKVGDRIRCGETPVAMPTDPSSHPISDSGDQE